MRLGQGVAVTATVGGGERRVCLRCVVLSRLTPPSLPAPSRLVVPGGHALHPPAAPAPGLVQGLRRVAHAQHHQAGREVKRLQLQGGWGRGFHMLGAVPVAPACSCVSLCARLRARAASTRSSCGARTPWRGRSTLNRTAFPTLPWVRALGAEHMRAVRGALVAAVSSSQAQQLAACQAFCAPLRPPRWPSLPLLSLAIPLQPATSNRWSAGSAAPPSGSRALTWRAPWAESATRRSGRRRWQGDRGWRDAADKAVADACGCCMWPGLPPGLSAKRTPCSPRPARTHRQMAEMLQLLDAVPKGVNCIVGGACSPALPGTPC